MTTPADVLAAALPGAPPAVRARTWLDLAEALGGAGERGAALLAARTAVGLAERVDDGLLAARALAAVAAFTGPDVVPLHVAVPAGDGADPKEASAVWLGAPVEPVLAMVGWREREGGIEVVRVVVPGTRRGRAALAPLLDALEALPVAVPVHARLPARDRALARAVARRGWAPDPAGPTVGGYLGGALSWRRGPDGGAR